MKLLEEFGINKADIAFIQCKNETKISLCVRGVLAEDKEVVFKVFYAYFNRYLVDAKDEYSDEIVDKAKMTGFAHAGDVSYIAKNVLKSRFEEYLSKKELDIVCEIEREQSPFYANVYSDLKIHKIA